MGVLTPPKGCYSGRMVGRVSARTLMIAMGASGALIALLACGDSTPPRGSGDTLIDDSHHSGDELPPPPDPNPSDAFPETSAPADGPAEYAPALNTCSSCSCNPATAFCFSGGVAKAIVIDAVEGGTEGGAADAAQPACPIVTDAATPQTGCNPLPAACAAKPTCACVIAAIQPQFACYLVCSPDPGFLQVYCPNPP
jgi:hypothetical protein